MVQYSGNDPRYAPDIQETFASKGLLVKYDASGLLMTASLDDTPIGYTAAESSRGEDLELEAAGTGTVAIKPLSGIVYIKFGETLSTLDFGDKIYVDDTVDGHCTNELDTSGKHLGYYYGESNISLSPGDLIPVMIGRFA